MYDFLDETQHFTIFGSWYSITAEAVFERKRQKIKAGTWQMKGLQYNICPGGFDLMS
jgi:hypothetical protein